MADQAASFGWSTGPWPLEYWTLALQWDGHWSLLAGSKRGLVAACEGRRSSLERRPVGWARGVAVDGTSSQEHALPVIVRHDLAATGASCRYEHAHGPSTTRFLRRVGSVLSEGPLLVAAAVARPELDQGAVGGGGSGHVQAQARLDAGDGAVGVDVPLLIGAPLQE